MNEKQERITFFDRLYRDGCHRPRAGRLIVEESKRLLRFLIPEGSSVLDIGCEDGQILASLKPSRGLGLDYSQEAIKIAQKNFSDYSFIVADCEVKIDIVETFSFILINNSIGDFF